MTQFQIGMFIGLVVVLGILGVVVGLLLRRRARHAKDIERSLKMVPLLLRLPPAEPDDSQRDDREEIKENISKAEGIFTLLSGTFAKSWLYSQRHIAFEIVAQGEQIFFYVAVPAGLVTSVLIFCEKAKLAFVFSF
jgi:hypothetical protein